MSEATDSKAQGILTILAAVSARSLTGVLRFQGEPGAEHAIEMLFREGKLLFATSTHPGERLAEFLVRRGVLSGESAKAALYEARRSGKFFHAYLVDEQWISQEALQDLLYQRTEELLDEILKSEDGHVLFSQMDISQLDHEAPGVDQELFGRLLKHRKLWPQLYQQFRNPDLVLQCVAGIESTSAYRVMGEAERKLLRLLDGKRPVVKLLERRKNRMDLMILLARFLDAGLIKATGGPAADSLTDLILLPPEPPAPQVPAVPVAAVAPPSVRPSAAFAVRPSAVPVVPPASMAPSSVASDEPAKPAGLPSIDLELVPTLSSSMDMAQVSLTGLMMDDLFLVSQINGRLSIRELVLATKMPESKLIQVLSRLLQHGYIVLQPRAVNPVRSAGASSARRTLAPLTPGAAQMVADAQVPASPAPPPPPPAPRTPEERAERLYQQALESYNGSRFSEAESQLRQMLSIQKRSAKGRARLALVLLERAGQERAAQTLAEEAFEEDPLLGQCLESMGLLKFRSGEYVEAKRLLEKAVLLDKQQVPAAARILGELKAGSGKKGESAEDCWWRLRRLIKLRA